MCLLLWFSLRPVSKVFMTPYWERDWKSVISADKAGYYAYLPATFIYGWNGEAMPDSIQQHSNYGIYVNEDGKIMTKYPVGVAYFELPFFLYTKYITFRHQNPDGLENSFNRSLATSCLFWTILGCAMLAAAIQGRTRNFALSWFVVLTIFFSTNLFFYALKSPGYSHPYTFFLFSSLLYVFPFGLRNISLRRWVITGFLLGLIFVTRTLNIVFAIMYITGVLLYANKGWYWIWHEKKRWLPGVIAAFVPLIPQLLYWKYAFGEYWTNSYKGEGFHFWNNPDFKATFISNNNGLLVYTPIWIFFLVCLIGITRKRRIEAITLWVIFTLFIYLCSSWSSPHFGCGFGHRVFVDMLPFAAVTMAVFIFDFINTKTVRTNIVMLASIFVFVSLCTVYTQRLTVNFTACWQGSMYEYNEMTEKFLYKTPDDVRIR